MQAELKWLTDPTIFQVNRLDAHSDHVSYAPGDGLSAGASSLRQSLDGRWLFTWSRNPAQRPADFWREDFDVSGFGTIQVPGHMEMQGWGQIHYTDTLYPWDGHAEVQPPEIDWEDAPVGSYIREFDLAPGLRGQRVCVSFQGVEQAAYVWLNGQFVGYAEDSFTPSEFDLTPFVRETGNRLCVEVHKRCSGGWLEDQDFFRFSGIFRSVYLYAKPELHLEDMWLRTGLLEDNRTGTLSIRLRLSGETEGMAVKCLITNPARQTLLDEVLELRREGDYYYSRDFQFADILPWSHESPNLYQVLFTLQTAGGAVTEIIPYNAGFRRFALKDGLMLLNGKRVVFNGVNRHEWNPGKGRAIGPEDMEAAIAVFRRNNINAVRTSHYPNQTLWYHLCDQNGIYMVDEANLETHGTWNAGHTEPAWDVPGSRLEWRDCVVDRARSMFERDKNHPAILFWSCGNESYAGENILAMANYFRQQDPSRLVHYEGCVQNRAFSGCTDVESRMYATPEAVRKYLGDRPEKPFLLCEYMHCMGNSVGGMESYIRLGEEFPQYQGGFIWDYMDQALWRTDCAGRRTLGYGGDFGDRQSGYSFSGNGIVTADGREKPAMQEVRYWYASQEAREAHDAANRRAEELLTLPAAAEKKAPLRVTHGDGALGVKGEDFEILFSRFDGGPVSLISGGREWLWRAPRPAYWRAPTENDRGCRYAWEGAVWSAADAWQRCTDFQILSESERQVSVRYTYTAPVMPDLLTEITYTADASGYLEVSCLYHGGPGRPQMPLFGLRFATPEPLEQTSWLGLSGETYPDRKKGGVYGWHREWPEIPYYLVPQECGCHTDTRAALLYSRDGSELALEMGEKPFAFSAIPYTPWQLEQAAHREELPPPVRTVVTVCGAMRGVGGIDSWRSDVEPAYRVASEKDIAFSFRVRL